MRRVVVTGLGMVSPAGLTVNESWDSVLAAKTGVARITKFAAQDSGVTIAAEVKGFSLGDALDPKESGRASPFILYAAKASQEALLDAGLSSIDPQQAEAYGCCIGVGIGALQEIEKNTLILANRGPKRVSPFFMPYTIPNMAAGVVSKRFNLKGPNLCTATACTSGTHSIGEAYHLVCLGQADIMVCGGSECAVSPLGIAAFASMKALSTNNESPELASRPFDRDRDGFVMGEGAGILVLEEYAHAKARGARIYSEVCGYGLSADAYHITAPPPEGEGAQRCMRSALKSAKVSPEDIDYINAHGTSTQLNDRYETAAIRAVFADHAKAVSISSTKGVTGHCLGAAGGIEAIFSVLALYHQIVPPTANLHHADPECPLDYTPLKPKETSITYALSNSFGFGGTNGTVIFKKSS
jgi:3-oxoacyl-[acyl-carrier-protein] synthase II